MAEKNNQQILMLVDGSNYMYRAFYAITNLSNSKGFPTNAIYGFTTMLMKLYRDWEPDYLAVIFDSKGPTFRHELYQAYKATRKAMPDDLEPQIPCIKEIVRAFSVPVFEEQGIEADDVIGSMVKEYSNRNVKIYIVSGDKDLLQLVCENVIMLDTMKEKILDIQSVKDRFGVEPKKVVEILGLAGDASDNIPGVPGVGEKTAQKLVEEFGDLETIIQQADTVKNKKVRNNLILFADQARLSRELATIRTDVPIRCQLEDLRRAEPDKEALKNLFAQFEFSSLIQTLKIEEEQGNSSYELICQKQEFFDLLDRLKNVRELALEFFLTRPDEPMVSDVAGLSIFSGSSETVWYIPCLCPSGECSEGFEVEIVLRSLEPILRDQSVEKVSYDIKKAFIIFSRYGVTLQKPWFDVMVAAYLLNPSRRGYELADIVREYLGGEIGTLEALKGKGLKKQHNEVISQDKVMTYQCRRINSILRLKNELAERMEDDKLASLFNDIEMPLVEVLASMEQAGVLIDTDLLHEMSEQLGTLMAISEEKIYQLAGERFNINSPKQLQVILFDKLGLPRGKKIKEGYSTNVEVLANLADSYELPAEILSYRSFAKLRSTYVDALPSLVNSKTGRLHTSYNQTVTATGRLSSSNPNLQNIPVRTTEGKRIRQAFISSAGSEIISSDYSQIELRILAHLSGDETLIKAFETGEDIHAQTASSVFGVFPEMVNDEMRRQAKVINFGIIYGMSPFGLSKELSISQKLAKTYIDEYFNRYQGVKLFLEKILEDARQNGYVATLLGRRRYIPEINNKNNVIRQIAERTAINTPIQGTAADMIKKAMINIDSAIKKRKLLTSMIMQVHDELIFEVPSYEKEEVINLVRREMEQVVCLKVPVKVNVHAGKNWEEAH